MNRHPPIDPWPDLYVRWWPAVLLALELLLALTRCARPAPRPPVPEVAGELERNVARVDLLAARQMEDAKLHAQATEYVLRKSLARAAGVRVASGRIP